jgi:PAS domain S-box-containing protein
MKSAESHSDLALTVADHVPAMLAYWDKDQICRFANKAYYEWFGKTAEQMIGKVTMEEFLGPLYKLNLPFIQGALNGKPQYFERDIPIPSGEVRHAVATYTPDVMDGKIKGFFVHVADITLIKDLEANLKKSELKFKGLLESAPDAIIIANKSGKIVLVNRQAERLFGYSKEELITTPVEILIPAHLHLAYVEHRSSYFKNPTVRPMGEGFELIVVRKNGSKFPVEISLSPLETSEGTLVSAAIRDITSRKVIEDKLKESEKLYRLISTNSKDLISLYNANENPIRIFISPSCKEIMGYDQDEMVNRSPFDFIIPEDVEKMRKATHPLTLSGKVAIAEYRARKKDGSIIWLESISNPFFGEDGKVIGFQTSARDITQRKLFENELMQAREQAEKASAKLRDLLEEKSDLVGLLSHDMRTPINQIKGLIQVMLMSANNTDVVKECLTNLDQAVKQQQTLYDNVLYMLKSDRVSKENNNFENIVLLDLVDKVCKNLEWDYKKKNLTISVNVPNSIHVNIQQELFTHAIQNLVTNAIKFSPAGKNIKVTAEQNYAATTIRIQDEGIGFAQEKAEHLFDRFTKEGRAGTNNETSVGLGLYLVKKCIENHNGTITANSNGEGTGALFTIQLPNYINAS